MAAPHSIAILSPADITRHASSLAAILLDAVAQGASIGFMNDLTIERAAEYWRAIAEAPGGKVVLACRDAEGFAGVVIVAPVNTGFQPHRAEILKMVVHSRAQGCGMGLALMQAAEEQIRLMGKTLATLFTRSGCSAERLYIRLGWFKAGVIPDDSVKPDSTLCDGAIYYKRITPHQ